MLSAMQGNAMPDISMMREKMQGMQNFQSGNVNLTQDDLASIQSDFSSRGIDTTDSIDALIDDFSEIDTNGDGISYEELNAYTGGNGMSMMGPPPGLFEGGQGGQGQMPPPPPQNGEESSSSSDYLDSLLESLYGEDEEESQTLSYSI